MRNLLNKFLVCNLYQINERKGYIDLREIYNKYSITSKFDELPYLNKIGEVIVKKSPFFKYSLKEIITDIPLDTVYEVYNDSSRIDWYSYTLTGNKKEYNTFILINRREKNPTLKELETYLNNHSDSNDYKEKLIELLTNGIFYYNNKKSFESKKDIDIKNKTRRLIKTYKSNQNKKAD